MGCYFYYCLNCSYVLAVKSTPTSVITGGGCARGAVAGRSPMLGGSRNTTPLVGNTGGAWPSVRVINHPAPGLGMCAGGLISLMARFDAWQGGVCGVCGRGSLWCRSCFISKHWKSVEGKTCSRNEFMAILKIM